MLDHYKVLGAVAVVAVVGAVAEAVAAVAGVRFDCAQYNYLKKAGALVGAV